MRNLEVCCRTRKGRNREINEDSFLAVTIADVDILAVADGLGGHAAGEVASKLAIAEIEAYYRSNLPSDHLEAVTRAALFEANGAISGMADMKQAYRDMASTMVVAAIASHESLVANVGDSRAYLVGETVTRITRDHSLVQQMIDRRLISEEESRSHSQRNIITMSLGSRRQVSPDYYPIALSHSTLLLCSDGLSNAVSDAQIGDIIRTSTTLENACSSLMKAAETNGAQDDVTIILAKRTQPGFQSSLYP
jgi:serine/threonine protein phosphatase PrpC